MEVRLYSSHYTFPSNVGWGQASEQVMAAVLFEAQRPLEDQGLAG